MSGPCPSSQNLAELLGRPADDPFWSHAESCPVCRAAILAYGEFLDPGPANPAFDLEEADRELARRLGRDLAASQASGPSAGNRKTLWGRPRFWYGLAAVLLMGIGVMFANDLTLILDGNRSLETELLRGNHTTDTRFSCDLEEGRIVLTWPECPDCDTFVVVLFDGDMGEVARISAGGPTGTTITDSHLVDRTRYCQVLLMSAGDVFQRGPILAPEPAGQ